jgi:hypothetical protein
MKSLKGDTIPADKNPIIVDNAERPAEIHDTLFSFEIKYDSTKNGLGEWNNYVKSITAFSLPSRNKIQVIVPPEKFPFESYNVPVIAEDMNFDGCTDIRIMSGFMVRGQTFYYFWLYDPLKGKFKEDTFLSNNMWDVQFDHKTKTVISNQRHAGPFNEINEVYAWENGKLVLQSREQCIPNPFGDDGDLTITKRIDGKLVTREKHFDTIPVTNTGSVIYDWEKLK